MFKRIIPLTLVALLTSTANADNTANITNFNYTALGVSLGTIDVDGLSEDLNAYRLSASYQMNNNTYLLGSYLSAENDVNGLNVTRNSSQIGIGGALSLMKFVDGFATISYARVAGKDCAGGLCIEDNDHGYAVSAGVKAWLTDSIDLLAALSYSELTQTNSDNTATNLGIGVWPAKQHRLGLGVINGERSDSLSLHYTFYPNL